MAFTYRDGALCAEQVPLEELARRFGTPCYVYSPRRSSRPTANSRARSPGARRSSPTRRLLSMHSAKGLEFPCVAVGGLGALGRHGTIKDDVRLTYVAITRATHEAFLTYSRVSPLVVRLVA